MRPETPERRPRRNHEIRAQKVRLIGQSGDQIGIVWLREALEAAEDAGLDLIEVAPDARPPVCRIMDWGRFRFEQQRRDREQRRKQRTVEVKSLRLRPTTDDHDFEVTRRKAERFLQQGHKVRVEVRFRGREITHRQLGREMLYRLASVVEPYGEIEQQASMEGRKMFIVIAPLPEELRPGEEPFDEDQATGDQSEPVAENDADAEAGDEDLGREEPDEDEAGDEDLGREEPDENEAGDEDDQDGEDEASGES